jgi:hypothetical protein
MSQKEKDKPVQEKRKSKAEMIWDKVSTVSLELFSLPNQLVSKHFEVVSTSGDTVYLKSKTSAAFPALDEALSRAFPNKFEVTLNGEGYISVKEKEPDFTL